MNTYKQQDSVEPLTDWKNEPTYKDLYADYTAAKDDHAAYVKTLEEYRMHLEGGKAINVPDTKSKARPRLIRKQNEWKYPSLEEPFLNTADMFEIKPRTGDDADAARQNGLLLNYQWATKINKVALIGRIVRNFVDEGTVVVKSGWDVEEGTIEEMVEQPIMGTPEQSLAMIQKQVAMGTISEEQAGILIQSGQPMQVGTQMVPREKIVLRKNQPTYEVCLNESVIIDPTCGEVIEDAKFIIHEFEIDMHTLLKDKVEKTTEPDPVTGQPITRVTGRYHNLEDVEYNTTKEGEYEKVYGENNLDHNFEFQDKTRKKMRAYEYWGYWDIDDDGSLKPIIATWIGSTLVRLEENPFPHGKLPFSIAANMPIKDSVRGEPAGALLVENQEQIGRMTRAINDMVSTQAVGQTFIDDQFLPNRTEKDNYIAGRTVFYRHGMDPKVSIHKAKVDAIDSTTMKVIEMYNSESEALTGTKAFSGGISGDAYGNTATGARSALDATSKRDLSGLRRLSTQLIADLGRKTIIMNQAFVSEEETVRLTNMEFVKVRREDLQGEFDLAIDVSTPEKDSETANDLGMVLQTNAANMDPDLAKIVLGKILRLKNLPDVALQVERFQPKPDPHAEKMKQMQVEEAELNKKKLEMEILVLSKQIESEDNKMEERSSRIAQNLQSETKENMATAKLKDAQAEKILAETDLLDQQFVDTQRSDPRTEAMEDREMDHQYGLEMAQVNQQNKNKGQ